MRKIEIKETKPGIIFEGSQFPSGVWLVTDGVVADEVDHFVYYEDEKRIEAKAVGVMSHREADGLLHNWPDTVSEVKLARPKRKSKKVVEDE